MQVLFSSQGLRGNDWMRFLSVSTADKQASNVVSNVVILQKNSANGLLDVILVIKLCKAVHAISSFCVCVHAFESFAWTAQVPIPLQNLSVVCGETQGRKRHRLWGGRGS